MRSAYRAHRAGGVQPRLLVISMIVGILAWCGAPAIASTNASVIYLAPPPATCPQTITFSAQISTTDFSNPFQSRSASYSWVFDDIQEQQQGVTFPTNVTTETVYWQRTFTSAHTGWVSLIVWQPASARAQNFPFQIVCSSGAGTGQGSVQPSPEDCVSYNSSNVADVNKSGTWSVVDGQTSLQQFGSEADALAGLAVARAHHQLCFIGRGKALQFLMEYWK
jgi:hypothetical protein